MLELEKLSAFVDGDLDQEQCAEVEAHKKDCPECAAMIEELEAMRGLARGAVVDPPRDLWPNVAARVFAPSIGKRSAQRGEAERRPAGDFTSPMTGTIGRMFGSPKLAWGVAAAMTAVALVFALGRPPKARPIDEARRSYTEAIARLDLEAKDAMRRLPPTTQEKLRANLQVVDRAIAECERALAAAPDDADGQEMLLAMYDEKARILGSAIDAADFEGEVRP
jgi:anti-sigma factor RsiW